MFNKEKLEKLATLDEVEEDVFNKEDVQWLRAAAQERSRTRRALADQLSQAIARYMSTEGIGFNEFQRRLGVSTATASKLIKGDGNVTLETIALVAELIGATPELRFELRA